jgi:hypothetical protein
MACENLQATVSSFRPFCRYNYYIYHSFEMTAHRYKIAATHIGKRLTHDPWTALSATGHWNFRRSLSESR